MPLDPEPRHHLVVVQEVDETLEDRAAGRAGLDGRFPYIELDLVREVDVSVQPNLGVARRGQFGGRGGGWGRRCYDNGRYRGGRNDRRDFCVPAAADDSEQT
jgi:hypothetical protein